MYKLIVVDDERVIREGLVKLVDWEDMGFEVAGSFSDGEQAIEYLKSNKVDVILTDIKMVGMTGIDIGEFIYQNKIDTKVVLLSGYREFDYAIKAIQYNIKDYLLKPTNFDELTECFTEIKKQLDIAKLEKESLIRKNKKFEEIMPILIEQTLYEICSKRINDSHLIMQRLRLIDVDIRNEGGKCLLLKIEIVEKSMDKYYQVIKNSFYSSCNNISFYPVIGSDREVVLLAISLKDMDKESFIGVANNHVNLLRENLKNAFNINTLIKEQQYFNHIFDIKSNKLTLSDFEKDLNTDIILDPEEVEILSDFRKCILGFINSGNIQKVIELVEEYQEVLGTVNLNVVKNFMVELFIILINKLREHGMNFQKETLDQLNYNHIYKKESLPEVMEWCSRKLDLILEKKNQQLSGNTQAQLINRAKEYIVENYNRDITLDEVAGHVYLSSVYFSRLFKAETGENFTDYVVRVRMDKAMELLKDPKLKMYEVSEMVGYSSTKYFSKLFKEHTGYNVTTYRENFLGRPNQNGL